MDLSHAYFTSGVGVTCPPHSFQDAFTNSTLDSVTLADTSIAFPYHNPFGLCAYTPDMPSVRVSHPGVSHTPLRDPVRIPRPIPSSRAQILFSNLRNAKVPSGCHNAWNLNVTRVTSPMSTLLGLASMRITWLRGVAHVR